jgi:Rrf2 family transcriptional regulator, cysteine metabolism repressor
MKLSTRARYSIRALLELALVQTDGPILLKDIAKKQQISLQYLEQLMVTLRRSGIVRSIRGPKGGVMLVKDPEDIKLSEVVSIFEGSLAPVECLSKPEICERADCCVTRDLWDELKQAMNGVLEGTTLRDLVERQYKKSAATANMYFI